MKTQLVYGVHAVLEALKSGQRLESLRCSRPLERGPTREIARLAKAAGVPVLRADRRELDAMVEGGRHQGVVASLTQGGAEDEALLEVDDPAELLARAEAAGEPPLLVALDCVQDPRNLGAVLRSAWFLGAHGVILPRDRSAPLSGVAIKAAAGAAARLPLCRVTNLARSLARLKEEGLWVYAADPEGASPLDRADLSGPAVLVLGGEGPGIRRLVLEQADQRLQIPMAGAEGSLNVSVAASICLYEVGRQRRAAATARKVSGVD